MKCIDTEIIQKYIDRETTLKEEDLINLHLSSCTNCAVKVQQMRKKSEYIKKMTGLLHAGQTEIPYFNKPVIFNRSFFQQYKRIIIDASAACIIGLGLFFFRTPPEKKIQFMVTYDLQDDYNANLPVSEQEMVITIIDSEGKLSQY